MEISERDSLRRAAAIRAVEEVEDGMVLGLGTGATTAFALEALAARVKAGLRVSGIPTSDRTAALARQLGLPLTSFTEHRSLDLMIDGADQVERGTLHLIKGLGGALLREKIVARAAKRLIIVVDAAKVVDRLGARTALPVEITSFGWQTVIDQLAGKGCKPQLRLTEDGPFTTDGGNYIADCTIADIPDPAALEARLNAMTGVIECGLFVGLAAKVIVGRPQGVDVLLPAIQTELAHSRP